MDLENIPQQSQKILDRVSNEVEKAGQKVANKVSHLAEGKGEEVTEEAIHTAIDQALNIIQVASEKVREKEINGERVTLEVGVQVLNVAHLKIITDVAENNPDREVDVEVS